jgi:hypothetical protein
MWAKVPLLGSMLHQIDPNLGISNEATMNETVDGTQVAVLQRFATGEGRDHSGWVALLLGLASMAAGAPCPRVGRIGESGASPWGRCLHVLPNRPGIPICSVQLLGEWPGERVQFRLLQRGTIEHRGGK